MNESILFSALTLIFGFVLLVKGADFFVEGSSSVAKKMKVPSIIIGLTIVAMGTSLPEAAVSISASIQGNNTLAISNAIGSNIFNLMVVIGMCAILSYVPVEKSTLKKDFPLSVICAALLLILGYIGMTLGHLDGIILLILFALFIISMVKEVTNKRQQASQADSLQSESTSTNNEDKEDDIVEMSSLECLLSIIGGMTAIVIGGDLVVDSATSIATAFGLSQTLIGLTIVSMGTSLPELVTSVVAAKKGEVDMALGNAIGSNIFNILMVLGLTACISPVAFITENIIDIVILIVFSVIVWICAWKKEGLGRKEGIAMVAMYAVYMVYICIR